ncbi:MAG: phosphopantetheine-binding protein [Planctomycetota bacterium]|jgi:acyl carrier protein
MPSAAPKSETLERLKSLIRRDLKLGDEVVISDDTPLVGGDFDLDSLDVLLLVTSVEKEFGIKIPNESVGNEAFRTVASLATFVQACVDDGAKS